MLPVWVPHQVAEGTMGSALRGRSWWTGPGRHTLRWMLKATVHYGPQEFGLQQKVPEARAVDGNVGPLDIFLRGRWGTLCRSLGLFIFLVIQKLIFDILFRHDAENRGGRKGPEEQLRHKQENTAAREKATRGYGLLTGQRGQCAGVRS